MFGNPFRLRSTLSASTRADKNDNLNTKSALGSLGYKHPNNNLFESIRQFQSDHGLKRDGIMKPNGETARMLGKVLENKRGHAKPSLLDPLPTATPDNMPGDHDRHKRKALDIAWPELPRESPEQTRDIKKLLELISRKAQDNEVVAESARGVKAALKTSDHSDLAKFHAQAVRDYEDDALAEVAEFGNQLKKANPEIFNSWFHIFRGELPDNAKRMVLAGNLGEEGLKGNDGKGTLTPEERTALREETVGMPPRKPESPNSVDPASEPGSDKGFESPVHQDFRDSLHKHESAEDGYKSFNPKGDGIGAFGRYQMRELALIDSGMLDDKGNWTGKHGVKNAEGFLNSPEAQERAFADYMSKTEGYLRHNESYDQIGRRFPGKLGKGITVTENGLLAAAHRQGHGMVKKYLEHQRRTNWKSDFSEYKTKERTKYESVETRLRLFQDVPYR